MYQSGTHERLADELGCEPTDQEDGDGADFWTAQSLDRSTA
jgi:hypothetical protein